MPGEINQTQEDKYCMILLTCLVHRIVTVIEREGTMVAAKRCGKGKWGVIV